MGIVCVCEYIDMDIDIDMYCTQFLIILLRTQQDQLSDVRQDAAEAPAGEEEGFRGGGARKSQNSSMQRRLVHPKTREVTGSSTPSHMTCLVIILVADIQSRSVPAHISAVCLCGRGSLHSILCPLNHSNNSQS